jgi:hypothetical protein
VLDEPFSGLDAINQEKLEALIRAKAAEGATIIFSTHVIAHAERLCEQIAIIAGGKVAFEGAVDSARDRLRPIVRLRTRAVDGPWRSALPVEARLSGREWHFELPPSGPEPLLRSLLQHEAGIETLSSSGLACTTPSSPSLARLLQRPWAGGTSRDQVHEPYIAAFVIGRRTMAQPSSPRPFCSSPGALFPILLGGLFGASAPALPAMPK